MQENKKLTILNIWNFFQPELKYHVHFLSENFTKLGHKVYFITTDKVNKVWAPFLKDTNYKAGKEEYPYATVYRLKCINIADKQIPVNWIAYYRILKNINPDVLHVLGIGNFLCWIGLILIRLSGKKVLIVANDHSNPSVAKQGLVANLYRKMNVAFFKILGHHYSLVISPNTSTLEHIKKLYKIPDARAKVIPLGYDDNLFRYIPEKKNNYNDQLVIAFAGKVEPRKNLEELLYAVAESKHKDNLLLRIAGFSNAYPDYTEKLEAIIKDKELQTELLPLMKREELVDFYNYADVAVYPGSLSITTVEASACGCPVLLNESIGGLNDRVDNGKGYLFNSRKELVELIDLYYNKKLNNQIDHGAIAQVTKTHSWSCITEEYLEIYKGA